MGDVIHIGYGGTTVEDVLTAVTSEKDIIEDITVIVTRKDGATQVAWSEKDACELARDSKLLDIMVTDFIRDTMGEE